MIALGRVGCDGYARGIFVAASAGRGVAFIFDVAVGAIRSRLLTEEDPICFVSGPHRHLGFRIVRFTGGWPMFRVYGRLFGRRFDRWIGG